MKKIDFKELVKPYKKEALETLIKDVQINSVYDPSTITDEHPYGEGVSECFKLLEETALKDGFNVDLCDGHCIEISYGEGENLIGVYAHQDVVPVNGVWKYPPFSATIENDVMYGRGTSDDKGPGIAAYYALKALKDNGLINNYRVRLVFGGDEERGSSCLAYYFKELKKEDPTYGFTPDADFPLVYGEKGITNYEIRGNANLGDVIELDCGTVSNSVIDRAKVVVRKPELLEAYLKEHTDIVYEKNSENTFTFIGKPAHGSVPEHGINSGIIALDVLGTVYKLPILSMLAYEYKKPNGENIKQRYCTEDLGETTYNVGIIKYNGTELKIVVNFRFPENVNSKQVVDEIQKLTPLPIYVLSNMGVLYFNPKTTKFIQVLTRIYEEETGDTENKPMAIGGGTYAKEAKNTVAFGSHFPGKEDRIHSANEKIDLEDFYNSIPLYARAIYELGNLKNEN